MVIEKSCNNTLSIHKWEIAEARKAFSASLFISTTKSTHLNATIIRQKI